MVDQLLGAYLGTCTISNFDMPLRSSGTMDVSYSLSLSSGTVPVTTGSFEGAEVVFRWWDKGLREWSPALTDASKKVSCPL